MRSTPTPRSACARGGGVWGGGYTRLLRKPVEQRPRSAAAVADRVLLVRRELGHRASVVAVSGDERGVVAEAAVAPGVVRERALAAPLDDVRRAAGIHECQRAHVGDRAVTV